MGRLSVTSEGALILPLFYWLLPFLFETPKRKLFLIYYEQAAFSRLFKQRRWVAHLPGLYRESLRIGPEGSKSSAPSDVMIL